MHRQTTSDDDDRQNRFLNGNGNGNGTGSDFAQRERAASQPPTSSSQGYMSSPPIPTNYGNGGNGSPWTNSHSHRLYNPPARGMAQPIPTTRSSSFSTNHQNTFSSAMRERSFSSTIEDDELEGLADTYDEQYIPPSLSPNGRGRTYAQDMSRSRSQSLATTTTRPGAIGGTYIPSPIMASWNESAMSNPLNIPGSRYGEIKPPGASRYGSLGTMGTASANFNSSSPSGGSPAVTGYSRQGDITNMSPFVRDVGSIVLDESSAFRELWGSMNAPRDENGGTISGTTSRRHSVSVVQPRRGTIVGFNAPGSDSLDQSHRYSSNFGGLVLSDDDLAGDFGLLSMDGPVPSSHPTSQPSSLPIFAPLSRSPAASDMYHPMNLGLSSSYTRKDRRSPSDSGVSGGSPPRDNRFEQDTQYTNMRQTQQQQQQAQAQPELTARFIPGQGIQYLPPLNTTNINNNGNGNYARQRAPSYASSSGAGGMTSPLSPTARPGPQYMQRRPSETPQTPLSELGKGVPLHAVPSSWPLFIVEFKAGRTDLFYLTDLSQDIRVGDTVIVEADRGKDLGKVINDSITLAEVEAFQKDQQARLGLGGPPNSPGGSGSGGGGPGKKEINPKMIYGKAQPQDAQHLVTKMQDELKALQLCQTKVRAKKLPMEVVDAEYQWDRRKLTFYFVAEKRIDFRELVRELFRLYKTRIWMASLQGGGGFEQ